MKNWIIDFMNEVERDLNAAILSLFETKGTYNVVH
ncbi:MAG: hypothetical protein ACI85O_003714 [Saprospiraceae bacterium]